MLTAYHKSRLVTAVREEKTADALFILIDHPDLAWQPLSNGKTVLHLAMQTGNHELICALVLREGVNVDARIDQPGHNLDGATPLLFGTYLEYVEEKTLRFLIEEGKANPSISSTKNVTTLMEAIYSKPEFAKHLLLETNLNLNVNQITHIQKLTALLYAAEIKCDDKVFKTILELSSVETINHKQFQGKSALYIAAEKGYISKVGMLLNVEGIDAFATHTTPGDNKPALQIALEYGHWEIAELIQNKLLASTFSEAEIAEIMQDPAAQAIFWRGKLTTEEKVENIEVSLEETSKTTLEEKSLQHLLPITLPSFSQYLKTQRIIPNGKNNQQLWLTYLKDLKEAKKESEIKDAIRLETGELKKTWKLEHIEDPSMPDDSHENNEEKINNQSETKRETKRESLEATPTTKASRPRIIATHHQRKAVNARFLFAKIVGDTYRINENYKTRHDPTVSVINKLLSCQETAYYYPQRIHAQLIDFLNNHFQIVITFNATKLRTFSYYHPLNVFQKNSAHGDPTYLNNRRSTEERLLKNNDPTLRKHFLENKDACFRYAAFLPIDYAHPIGPVLGINGTYLYGRSFIVFKDVVKFASLFVAGNAISNHLLKPNTFHHLDLLLDALPLHHLYALANRVTHGQLQNYRNEVGQCMEALIPATDLFKKELIDHIHVSGDECTLSAGEIEAFYNNGEGIKVPLTNTIENPYIVFSNNIRNNVTDNNIDEVKALLTRHPSLLKVTDEKGKGLLHLAAQNGHPELVKFLIEKGSPLNELAEGKTPLHFALEAKQNRYKTLEALLTSCYRENDKGGVTKFRDLNLEQGTYGNNINDGSTPLIAASRISSQELKELKESKELELKEPKESQESKELKEPQELKEPKESHNSLKLLLKYGANISATKTNAYDALAEAVYHNQLENVKILVNTGTNINRTIPNETANSLLTIACIRAPKGDTNLLQYLLNLPQLHLTTVNHKNTRGESALFIAAATAKNDIAKVKILLTFPGIDYHAKHIPGDGKTALEIAIEKGYQAIAILLRSHQLKEQKVVASPTPFSQTPMLAAETKTETKTETKKNSFEISTPTETIHLIPSVAEGKHPATGRQIIEPMTKLNNDQKVLLDDSKRHIRRTLEQYASNRGTINNNQQVRLTFFSYVFRNNELTTKKLRFYQSLTTAINFLWEHMTNQDQNAKMDLDTICEQLKVILGNEDYPLFLAKLNDPNTPPIQDYPALFTLVVDFYKGRDAQAEQEAKVTHSSFTKSRFKESLGIVETAFNNLWQQLEVASSTENSNREQLKITTW